MKIFGFEIKRANSVEDLPTPVSREVEPGTVVVEGATGFSVSHGYTPGVPIDAVDTSKLVARYREMANHPDVNRAISDICNEAIVLDHREGPVRIDIEDPEVGDKVPDKLKKRISEEFETILRSLEFNTNGYEIFRQWYIDGRLYYYMNVEKGREKEGIKELIRIDPRKIAKINVNKRVAEKDEDKAVKEKKREVFIYNDVGLSESALKHAANGQFTRRKKNKQLTSDSVAYVSSGVYSSDAKYVRSYLHYAIKALNKLDTVETAAILYRLTRSSERRAFYFDLGTQGTPQSEQYLKEQMNNFKNTWSYDPNSGRIVTDRKHLSMSEDYFFSRRGGEDGTRVENLSGGSNISDISDIRMWKRDFYRALNVPYARVDTDQEPSLHKSGRPEDITRDEIQYSRFIGRLRNQFSKILYIILHKQLILKGIIRDEQWHDIKHLVKFIYVKDNHFRDFKKFELLTARLDAYGQILGQQLVGKYFSHKWIRNNIFDMNDVEIDEMHREIKAEKKKYPELYAEEEEFGGAGAGVGGGAGGDVGAGAGDTGSTTPTDTTTPTEPPQTPQGADEVETKDGEDVADLESDDTTDTQPEKKKPAPKKKKKPAAKKKDDKAADKSAEGEEGEETQEGETEDKPKPKPKPKRRRRRVRRKTTKKASDKKKEDEEEEEENK